MSNSLSARFHLENRKAGDSVEVIIVQRVPQGGVDVLVPEGTETLDDVVSRLILGDVPPSRIWPARLSLGSVVSLRVTVTTP